MSFSEVIRWGPLGPGGDPQMSLQGVFQPGVHAVTSLRRKRYRMELRERRRRNKALSGLSGRLQGLGAALAPDAQADLTSRMSQLQVIAAQVDNETAEAYTAHADAVQLEAWQIRYDKLLERMFQLQADAPGITEQDWEMFRAQVETLQRDYNSLLGELFDAREARGFGRQASGLLWGLGSLTVAATVLWAIQRQQKKRKR